MDFQEIKALHKKIEEKEDTQLEDVTIKEEITYDEVVVSQSDIMTREEAMEILLNGTEGYKEYEVQRSDSSGI